MADPNLVNLASLTYQSISQALNTALQTVAISGAAQTQIIDSLTLSSTVAATVTVNLTKQKSGTGTQIHILASTQLTGFSTTQISGPIVLQPGDCLNANTQPLNSQVEIDANLRVIS